MISKCRNARKMCALSLALALLLAAVPAASFTVQSTATTGAATARTTRLFLSKTSTEAIDESINEAKSILCRAAETKAENSDTVVQALLDLEKLMRQKNRDDSQQADRTLQALSSSDSDAPNSWRLVFTTGTINTQKRSGRINYFPIKAVQTFGDAKIQNGIYVGDFPLLKFSGDFDWTASKNGMTKVTFDFDKIQILNTFDVQLKAGEAANLGAKSGLGSENNVELNRKGKRAFFNWISADDQIATARGGGGGLALWKRVEEEQ